MHRSGEIKRGHFLTRREKSIWSLFLKFLLRRKMCALATSNILDNGLESRSKETVSIDGHENQMLLNSGSGASYICERTEDSCR